MWRRCIPEAILSVLRRDDDLLLLVFLVWLLCMKGCGTVQRGTIVFILVGCGIYVRTSRKFRVRVYVEASRILLCCVCF